MIISEKLTVFIIRSPKSIYIFLLIFLMCNAASQGQSLNGLTGLLNIPSADMQEDGTFYAGVNYINQQTIHNFPGDPYDRYAWYFDITFLPFLEVNFRSTTFKVGNDSVEKYNVDRMASVRLRILRERKYWPAIVIGNHDLYTTVTGGGNQYFSAAFIVATKHIAAGKSDFGFTVGYGFNVHRNIQYDGIFGGISFSPSFYRQLNLIAEYDGNNYNLGFNILLFKHLFIFAMANDLRYFSGGIAYRVYLLNYYKKNKKKILK